jgi:hypothetical protein
MAANCPDLEPDDLYTRDFLVRVPNASPQDSRHNEGHHHSALLPLAVSCLSMAAMIIYQLTLIRVFAWDIKIWMLVLFTGGVSFALAHIWITLFFSEE